MESSTGQRDRSAPSPPQELAALAGTEIALKHAAMVLLQLRLELVEVDHGIVVVPGWV
jgi:hypothetical protein